MTISPQCEVVRAGPRVRPRDHEGVSWQWDPSLYEGAASHYARGRVAYPPALADLLAAELGLDGSGRLLDVGCGPGSLTLLLAPLVAEATGVDADPGMIAEAEDLAVRAGVRNVRWRVLRAAERRAGQGVLPDGTPSGEERSYRTAGFSGPRRLELPGQLVERSADEVVAAVLSLSGSAPHLFGPRLAEFDADLRALLRDTSPTGVFSQQMREIAVDLWTP
jgi:SAM-dependent methyltransferase